MRYGLAALAALLLLSSCSPPAPVIRARVVNGQIVFEAIQRARWWFQRDHPDNLRVDRLMVYGRAGATWVIERRRDGDCGGVGYTFPVTYGHLPLCFVERLHATALRPGILYRISTEGGGPSSEGYFRIALTVDNPAEEAVRNDIERWPAGTNPDTTYETEPREPQPPGDTNLLSDNVVLETPPD